MDRERIEARTRYARRLEEQGHAATERLVDLVEYAIDECEAGCSDSVVRGLDGAETDVYDVVVLYGCQQFVERWEDDEPELSEALAAFEEGHR